MSRMTLQRVLKISFVVPGGIIWQQVFDSCRYLQPADDLVQFRAASSNMVIRRLCNAFLLHPPSVKRLEEVSSHGDRYCGQQESNGDNFANITMGGRLVKDPLGLSSTRKELTRRTQRRSFEYASCDRVCWRKSGRVSLSRKTTTTTT